MKCPKCESRLTKVIYTEKIMSHVIRHRVCPQCSHHFETEERRTGEFRKKVV